MVFSGISLTALAGSSLLIRGPNGAGKSSLLRLLAGLLPCRYGRIERNAPLALADEHLALDGTARLREALAFWAHIDGIGEQALAHAMTRFALEPLADIPVRMLSTGQRKRAILARTMASGARLWLLDEPGNGLDSASLAILASAMDDHIASGGAIIAASHFDLTHRSHSIIDIGVTVTAGLAATGGGMA
ncbi:MAG: heme ABC exporter ATP-binding protein CcmA [Sphingomonadales bacterium]|nr:MAG: heme ABC exporter ATP-binding protein CcmA [Sphingomonadales bacterium]